MYFAWFWEITPIESSETTDMGKIANVNFGRNTDMGFFPSTSGSSVLDVFFFWRPEFYCNGHCLKPPRSPGGLRVGESNTVHCSGEKKPTNNFLFQLLSEVFFSGNPFFLDSYELWVFFFFSGNFSFQGQGCPIWEFLSMDSFPSFKEVCSSGSPTSPAGETLRKLYVEIMQDLWLLIL